MITKIDIQKSIAKKKLVFRMNLFDRCFGLYVKFFLATIFPFATVAYTIQHPELLRDHFGDQAIVVAVVANLAACVLSYLMVEYFKNPTRLLRVRGDNIDDNKVLAIKVLKEMNCSIEVEQADLLIAIPQSILHNRQLTIIFAENDILISSLSFGRNQGVGVYHQKAAELFVKTFQAQRPEQISQAL